MVLLDRQQVRSAFKLVGTTVLADLASHVLSLPTCNAFQIHSRRLEMAFFVACQLFLYAAPAALGGSSAAADSSLAVVYAVAQNRQHCL
jgi:hypothetical protein